MKSNYYCIGKLLQYCIILHYSLLPNKYLDLNQTKVIAGVSGLGPCSLYNYYTNAHPLYGTITKLEKV